MRDVDSKSTRSNFPCIRHDAWGNPELFTPRYAHMLDCNISFTETVFNKYARHATVWITLPADS